MAKGRIRNLVKTTFRALKKKLRDHSGSHDVDISETDSRHPESAGHGEHTTSSGPFTANAEEVPSAADQLQGPEINPETAEEQESKANRDDTIDAWITNAQKVISVAVTCTSNVPIASQVLPPLQAIVDRLAETRANIREKKEVLEEIESLAKTIEAVGKGVHAELSDITDVERQDVMDEINKKDSRFPELSGITEELQQLEISIRERPQRGQFGKIAYAAQDAEFLKGVRANISAIRQNIQIQDGHMLRALLIGAVRHARTQSEYVKEQREKDDLEVLKQLQPVHASYKADATEEKSRLTEGTRAQILDDLAHWAQSEQPSHRVYVLYGQAGMGKSSIAHALCQRLGSAYLGASFFFIRGQFNDPRSLFPSLAYQLAHSRPDLRPLIINAVKDYCRSGQSQRLKHQIEELLKHPLRAGSMKPGSLVLFVVDGIDECLNGPDDMVPQMLQLLCQLASEISSIRILLATRPETYILDALRTSSQFSQIQWRDLQKEPGIDDDIRLFIKTELERAEKAGGFHLLTDRPRANEELTRLSDGLFVWANTAIRFLQQDKHLAARIYDMLLASQGAKASSGNYDRLDELYRTILNNSFDRLRGDEERMHFIQLVLAWLAMPRFLFLEGQIESFDGRHLHVTGIPIELTIDVVDRLRSVLIVDGDITPFTPIRACHASFPQFLMDPTRCTDPAFLVDPPSGHALIAISLLDLLARDDVDSLWDADGDMPPMWSYARLSWIHHLVEARYTPELGRSLRHFVETHLEDWLRLVEPWGGSDWSKFGVTDWCARVLGWYKENGPDDGLVPMLDEILDRRVKEVAAEANQSPAEFDWDYREHITAWVMDRYPREGEQASVG